MTRKPSSWNIHVKKVYEEGKKKNPSYKFSNALKDASSTYVKNDKKDKQPKENIVSEKKVVKKGRFTIIQSESIKKGYLRDKDPERVYSKKNPKISKKTEKKSKINKKDSKKSKMAVLPEAI